MSGASRLGAYGLAVRGLDEAAALLAPVPSDWPEIRLTWQPDGASSRRLLMAASRAEYPLESGGHVVLDRVAGTATLRTPEAPAPDVMAHPRLGMVAAVYGHWLGDDVFHAGAFGHGGGAWAVVGQGGEGKSSLLSALHAAGMAIVADDTLVIRNGSCLSGVRCIDLRPGAAEALGLVSSVVPARAGARARLATGPPPPPIPLGGWFFLRWGQEVAIRPVQLAERLRWIGGLRGWHRRGAGDAARLLALAALPAWELRRPRDWGLMPGVVKLLDSTLRAATRSEAAAR